MGEIRTGPPRASKLYASRSVPLSPSSRVMMSVWLVGILGSAWVTLVSVRIHVSFGLFSYTGNS